MDNNKIIDTAMNLSALLSVNRMHV